MTKNEFMSALRAALLRHNIDRVEEILSDYEEHYQHALALGKAEDAVSKKLGIPETIARAYETTHMIEKIKDPSKNFRVKDAVSILGRLILLAPFNFLVIFLPGSILLAFLIFGWGALLTLILADLTAIFLAFQSQIYSVSHWFSLGIVSGMVAGVAAAVLLGYFMFAITRRSLLFSINYLQWNLKFILER